MTLSVVSTDDVLAVLSSRLESPTRLSDELGRVTFEGTLVLNDTSVQLQIILTRDFPLDLPHVRISPPDSFGDLPHVAPDGLVCFLDREGTVLDQEVPEAIIIESIDRSIKLLEEGIAGKNLQDFTNEFEACWAYLKPVDTYYLISDPGTSARTLGILEQGGGGVVAKSNNAVELFLGSQRREEIRTRFKPTAVLYLPLQSDSYIRPPYPDRPFWTPQDVRSLILDQMHAEDRDKVLRIIGRDKRPLQHFIVSLPRPKGGNSIFGIRMQGLGEIHPLMAGGTCERIIPVAVTRLYPEYLSKRGGVTDYLDEKNVLIVGCGSVGGRIAVELARTGVGSLTLIDPDIYQPENTYRHVLGCSGWGQPKVVALSDLIRMAAIQPKIKHHFKSIVDALTDGDLKFDDFDLVVFATGDPTLELRMNSLLEESIGGPSAVFTWLEPLGIGGHALLSRPAQPGCLRCLYENPYDGSLGLYNSASFAKPGQTFGKALSGCGTSFTPFSSLDAAETALVATRLAISALVGSEMGSPLVSWQGSASEFARQGFELSARHGRPIQFLHDSRYSYIAPQCPVCGGESGVIQQMESPNVVSAS